MAFEHRERRRRGIDELHSTDREVDGEDVGSVFIDNSGNDYDNRLRLRRKALVS
jgi:hypothetical protein